MFKTFDKVWHAGLFRKLSSYEIFRLIIWPYFVFLSNRQFWVVLDEKAFQEYPVAIGALQGCILSPTLFLLCINDLLDCVIRNIAIYSDTALYFKWDQTSDLWQQPELSSEPKSDLRDTVARSRKWLVDFNAGKSQIISLSQSNNSIATDVKVDGSIQDLLSFWSCFSPLNQFNSLILYC